MRRFYQIILSLLILIALFFLYLKYLNAQNEIVIVQIVDHPALNRTREGIEDHLASCCSNFKIKYENAQGNTTLALQIAQKIISSKPKLIIAIGTIAAQAFLKNNAIPIVFSSITDPISAGLNKSNFTGVSNMVDIYTQLKLIKDLLPNASKIGIIYNNAEANSVVMVKKIREISPNLSFEIEEAVALSSNEVVMAAQNLANKKVDAIFISNDNTALSSISGISKSALQNSIPVFSSDIDTIMNNVLAAIGPDQYRIGIQTGIIAEKILNGAKPSEIPISYPEKIELKINKKISDILNIQISDKILRSASEVIK
jgi:putative ABC transport system substrate-binding protein